jgi:hypothetical protein
MAEQTFTFSELAGGAVEEALQHALNEVMENVNDPNTNAKKARKLTLTVTLKPAENRMVTDTEFFVKTVLVAPNGINTTLLMERNQDGKMVAREMYGIDPRQGLAWDGDGVVVPIRDKEAK